MINITQVFRGVVGMAYVGHWRQGKDPEKEDIVQQYEELPRDPVSGGVYLDNGLIHFDLDTQNCKSSYRISQNSIVANERKP